jgi:hypothetical protein
MNSFCRASLLARRSRCAWCVATPGHYYPCIGKVFTVQRQKLNLTWSSCVVIIFKEVQNAWNALDWFVRTAFAFADGRRSMCFRVSNNFVNEQWNHLTSLVVYKPCQPCWIGQPTAGGDGEMQQTRAADHQLVQSRHFKYTKTDLQILFAESWHIHSYLQYISWLKDQ